MTAFRELATWAEFDWIDDSNPMLNSYFRRCIKTGPRTYRESANGKPIGATMRVGSHNANVFHVVAPKAPEVAQSAPRRKPRRWSDSVRDPLDEKDNLGESPDY